METARLSAKPNPSTYRPTCKKNRKNKQASKFPNVLQRCKMYNLSSAYSHALTVLNEPHKELHTHKVIYKRYPLYR